MPLKPPTLLIRVDATPSIGVGHLMRCLAIAQAWTFSRGKGIFVTGPLPDPLRERLEKERFPVVAAAGKPGDAEDIAATIAAARKREADWVILDGYPFGEDFRAAVKASGIRLLVVDDDGDADRYTADLLLNPNPHGETLPYPTCAPGVRLLLGPAHAPLRREFLRVDRMRAPAPAKARKLLLTLGGADPDDVTSRVLDGIFRLADPDLRTRVLVGPANPRREGIAKRTAESDLPIKVEPPSDRMPETIAWADMALSAGGSTCWELAYLGIPNAMVVLADNQAPIAAALDTTGTGINLGWHADLDPAKIAATLGALRDSRARRAEMSRRGRTLVDGRGAERVITAMRTGWETNG